MKKAIVLLFVLFPLLGFTQKIYEISGMSIKSQLLDISTSGILRAKGTISIEDSSFTTKIGNQSQTYKIIKKVDDNYFQVTDGLKESTVRIINQKFGKYSGVINIESDKQLVSCFIK